MGTEMYLQLSLYLTNVINESLEPVM